ncbi:hypothetical protein GS896_27545 [Rhodococcus hoagii]|nr:hypothetical protein [Prescottella equi]MBM4654007.1 hypothetical protein [Prescottella equi]MBM4719730.1 hypothetical protein [Prescottella equi]NKR23527.1 hypothetical protein [Prescottella equi]NKT56319.1 hypothetical protein [Prescottella equi]
MANSNTFGLKRPCVDCPFRTDRQPFLRPDRAAEIADALEAGEPFWCHKTVEYDEDQAGESVTNTDGSTFCAGALATLEREGRPNNAMRIAERLGLYRPDQMATDVPVHNNLQEWVHAH